MHSFFIFVSYLLLLTDLQHAKELSFKHSIVDMAMTTKIQDQVFAKKESNVRCAQGMPEAEWQIYDLTWCCTLED